MINKFLYIVMLLNCLLFIPYLFAKFGAFYENFNVTSALLLVSASLASPAVSESSKDILIAAPWEVTSYDTAVSGFAFQRLGVMENLLDADAR